MRQAAFCIQSSKQGLGRIWLEGVRRLTAVQLGDRREAGGRRARLCVATVLEGPARQAVSWGQSSEADLGPTWVYQWLEHGICAALWAPISWVPTAASMWDRWKVGGSKARRWAEALKGPTQQAVFRGQSSRWNHRRMWLGRLRWPVMAIVED